ncbi:MAG: hypothetical protein GWM98_05015, partial [Nitrospinaceae bacterium]|nr:hypothetical protein [Nitrospinaceae bacterium]NIR53928.1 hypothetical protein [Nitrospinaceae bacterium]NIS84346.1 hypothetical protein [Nitrospinaceae bacterium]NIT81149.1 hypothetical protein [Nitrospinaceae bacterium]NIU43431.1 hypothetical protein [Nitrospinaceae bacterium]
MSRCQSPVLRFLLVLLGMGCLLGGGTVDASGASRSSLEQELERVVSGPEDRIALADTLLFISQKWEPGLDPEPLREKLDRLTEAVDQKITPSSSPDELVRALTDTLHGEFGYRYTESVDAQGIPKNPDELFLHGLLQTGRGYCMNLSLLYLIVAERLDLPLYGVPLPNHFFVRYDDGTTQINIEATEKGALYPDRFYRERFNVPESSSYFMNNLGPRGTLGAYFSNVGMVYYRNQKPEEAVLYLQASTSINSHSLEAH